MAQIDRPILSICIPTFNRADKLAVSLLAIAKQVVNFQGKIEVIVSDNASTDSTHQVLEKFKREFLFLKVYRNEINLGPNLNFFRLSDKYATGKYLWLIGDDDVVDSNAIGIILKSLEDNPNASFLGLNFRIGLPEQQILNYQLGSNKSEFEVEVTNMSRLLDNQCRAENLLATFISCNIILLDKFKDFDKRNFSSNSWDDYKSLFPHTHIISSVIKPGEKVIYIKEPLLSVMIHEKDWDEKLAMINLYYIIDVYKFYLKCSFEKADLKRAKNVIIKSGLSALLISRLSIHYKWYFVKFFAFDLSFYELLTKKIVTHIFKLWKKS